LPTQCPSRPTRWDRRSRCCRWHLSSLRRSSGYTRTGASASSSDRPVVMNGQELVELIVLIVCFFIAALASGTETALTSVGRLRVRFLAEQGSEAAVILQRLRADPNRFLSTVLFTNTLALIVASTATALMSDSILTRAGVPDAWRLWLTLFVSLLLSVVLLIVAEVTTKTLAIAHAERWALAAATPVERVATFLSPI